MTFMFDLDGVLCTSQEEMVHRLSERTGKKYTINDWVIYDYKKSFGDDARKMRAIMKENVYTGERCVTNKTLVDKIQSLVNKGHTVIICSYCYNEESAEWKWEFLSKYVDTRKVIYKPVFKDVKHKLKCDVIIEDCMDTLLKMSRAEFTGTMLLVSKPWNELLSTDGTNIIRCKNCEDVCKEIDKLIKE